MASEQTTSNHTMRESGMLVINWKKHTNNYHACMSPKHWGYFFLVSEQRESGRCNGSANCNIIF